MSTRENLTLIEEIKTDYQVMRFYEDEKKKLLFTLDGYAQFKEGDDEKIYHIMLTFPAIVFCRKPANILILGGGDGLVARNLFLINPDFNVTLVEIDPLVIQKFRTDNRLTALNRNSLKQCNVIIDDAKKFVVNCKDKYNMIILDFPDPNSTELEELYTEKFYKDVTNLLERRGIVTIQANYDKRHEIENIIKKFLNYTEIFVYKMPWMGTGSIVVGQRVE